MTLTKRQRIIAATRNNIEAFGKYFMPEALNAATPDFHKQIYKDLEDDSIKQLGIIAPRGHSKSTVASIVFILHKVLFKPESKDLLAILISESQSQAINFLSVVKYNLLYNQKIVAIFGDIEGDKWTEDEIVTSNGARILAKGTGQKIRGTLMGRKAITRPNLIVLDDFESESNSATTEAIEKNKDWILKAVLPSLSDDGRIVAIGTIIDKRAFLTDIQLPGSGWKVHFFQAFTDGEKMQIPLWPERFSRERLMNIYNSLKAQGKAAAFWQEYMNLPIDMENQTFRSKDFRYWNGEWELVSGIQPCIRSNNHPMKEQENLPDNMMIPLNISLGVDPAVSEAHTADWSVVFPWGTDPFGYRFVMDYSRLKTQDIDVLVDAMLKQGIQHGASYVNIETVQYQQAIANQFIKKMDEVGVYFTVSQTKPRTSKDARIRSLQPLFRAHRVFHQEHHIELEEELLNYPSARHDDLLDGMYYAEMEAVEPDMKLFEGTTLPEPEETEETSWLTL